MPTIDFILKIVTVFQFLAAALMGLLALYLFIGLLPGPHRRQQELERQIKAEGGTTFPMSRFRRALVVVLCGFIAAENLAGAFKISLAGIIGVNPQALFFTGFILVPAAVFLLGVIETRPSSRK